MPIDAKSVQWDAPPKLDSAAVEWDEAPKAPVQEEKALGPYASALVRPLAKGVGALPLMAMDAGVGVRNFLTGENYEHPTEMFNRALDSYTTVPEGAMAGAEAVNSMLAGGALGGAPSAAVRAPAGFQSALPKATNAIQEFEQRGIPLTAGRKTGKAGQAAEDFLANVPLVGGKVAERQKEMLEAWNLSVLKQVDNSVTQGGKEGFKQAGETLSNAYKSIWKDELPFNRSGLKADWAKLAGGLRQQLPKEQADEVTEALSRHFKQILSGARQNGTQGETLSSVDDALREAAKQASRQGEGAVAGAYNNARTAFRDQMDPAVNAALKQTDKKYMELSVLRNAAKRSGWDTFTPAQLLMASKKKASDAAVAEMRAPFQEEALKAADVLGTARSGAQAALERGMNKMGGRVLGAAALGGGAALDLGSTALAATMGRLAYTKAGQKLLTQTLPKAVKSPSEPTQRVLTQALAQLETE